MEAAIDGRKGVSVNWEGSAISRPMLVVKPERISELIEIMKSQTKYPSPVRAVGFQHSITRCAVADGGTLVDMRHFNRILEFGQGHVRVQAGIRIYDLVKALDSRGLQLCACPEFGDISAGSVACTSNRYISSRGILGQLSSTVVAMKLVTPQGAKLDITAKQPDMLNVMRSSFGLMGIVYEVTFAVRDKIGFVVERQQMALDDLSLALAEIDTAGTGIELTLYPFSNKAQLEIRHSANLEKKTRQWAPTLRAWGWNCFVPFLAQVLKRVFPIARPRAELLDVLLFQAQKLFAKVADDHIGEMSAVCLPRCRLPDWGRCTYTTWAFPAEDFSLLIDKYVDFCHEFQRNNKYRCDLPTKSVFVPKDTGSLLSYAGDGDMYTLDVFSSGDKGWEDFLIDLNEFCSENNGVPLLNQTKLLSHRQAAKGLGIKLRTFKRLRRNVDRNNRLSSTFYQPLVG
jgi:FAD/FMN-containing dehydrogenase